MHSNETADLVIVGGGFAGLACAQASAARGVRTIVLERKPQIGDRIHTTGIFVKEAADRLDLPREHTRKIAGVRLYGPSLSYVDLVSPGYYFLATDTAAVLRWQAKLAESAGAEIRCGVPFSGAFHNGSEIVLDGTEIRSRYLVGADGARSRVAAAMGLSMNREFLLGVEAEWTGVKEIDPNFLHVFLDSRIAPGYIAWVVPGVDGVTQIGLAAHERRSPKLEPFLQKLQTVFDFSAAQETNKRGGLIPCGGTLQRISNENVILIGDAAGTVSPLTAGGIHPALEIGRLAGIAVSDYLLDQGLPPMLNLRGALPKFAFKRVLRTVFSSVQPPNWIYDTLIENGRMQRLARTVFFHHRGLLAPAAWKDLWQASKKSSSPVVDLRGSV